MYSISFTPMAQEMLAEIEDRRIRQKIADTVNRLTRDPEKQGKPLTGPLLGFRSLRAAGQRFRIVYTIRNREILVVVVRIGPRKEGDKGDIYRRLQKLIRLNLI